MLRRLCGLSIWTVVVISGLTTLPAGHAAEDPRPPAGTRAIDFIIARVGSELVLFSDLQRIVAQASQGESRLSADGRLEGTRLTAKDVRDLLETLVDAKVLSIKARELGLSVDEHELDMEINRLLKARNTTEEQLRAMAEKNGESFEDFREEFRRQLEQQRVIGQIVQPRISVTDEEVQNYYMRQVDAGGKKQLVQLRNLIIHMPESLTAEQRRTKEKMIETIQREAVNVQNPGKVDFDNIAKLYADEGPGNLAPRPHAELMPELSQKITPELAKGTVIGPIKVGSDVFFFRYEGMTMQDSDKFEKQKAEWKQKLLDTKLQEGLAEYLRAESTKIKIQRMPFEIK